MPRRSKRNKRQIEIEDACSIGESGNGAIITIPVVGHGAVIIFDGAPLENN
jgi:hypothetical protein